MTLAPQIICIKPFYINPVQDLPQVSYAPYHSHTMNHIHHIMSQIPIYLNKRTISFIYYEPYTSYHAPDSNLSEQAHNRIRDLQKQPRGKYSISIRKTPAGYGTWLYRMPLSHRNGCAGELQPE